MSVEPASGGQRVDQWLWFSRLVKSRTLAQALIERGKVRINRIRIEKASHGVKAGDVLTLSMGPNVRIFEVLAIGARRGPATEASKLYRERDGGTVAVGANKTTTVQAPAAGHASREEGAGRPTKRDRRKIDQLKGRYERP